MPGEADVPKTLETLEAERAHLGKAREALRGMREHAESLSADAAGDWVSRQVLESLLDQRVRALADHPDTPLFFGRLDHRSDLGAELPETVHVGRRHVHDEEGLALVLDWRAPVSRAFYRAGPRDPMGVARRRRFGFDRGELTGFEDEPLDGRELGPSRLLTEEIERPRTGPMRDIVATIQPEQDVIVRAELSETVCVQGAPGTGKTAVGLHRAAYLLFAHRERLSRAGVLIVGPNRAFLSYIASVLPALGEVRVDQATVDDLLGIPTGTEALSVAALKGDVRLAEVLRKALWMHLRKPETGLLFVKGGSRYRIPDHEIRELVSSLRGTTRYGAGRHTLTQRLAHRVLVQMEQRGEAPDDRVHDAVARSKAVKAVVEQVWPKVTPQQILHRLFSDAEFLAQAARGLLDEEEQELLRWRRAPRSARSAKWTPADLALLDELADLVERTGSLGHLVVDEAQDLSPMQLRALGRRCATGSATVLGDLAQGTTPWAARTWREVLVHLGQEGEVTELTLGFRVPREVLDYAARLLPSVAPELAAPRSLRGGPGTLSVRKVRDVHDAAVTALLELQARDGSLGVVVADDRLEELGKTLEANGVDHAVLTAEGVAGERVHLVPATLAKGLEYDHVVVAEPAEIVAAEEKGLARLYVVLTRAVTSLTVLHHEPLPVELG
ncbi:AAA family ATPase [Actinocorallia aurantiaca]|uniref:AAA family ATPase n=1 Tax=Actinocorallia aurantiaca TaxID=46204 RepID=A0ABP6GKL5_9ACTN